MTQNEAWTPPLGSLTREQLSEHVTQAIAEQINVSTMILLRRHDPDGDIYHVLRPGGEWAIWEVVRRAITEAGWKLTND